MSEDNFFIEDEPIEKVLKAFGEGQKFITLKTYEPKNSEPVQAIQWLPKNRDVALEWLEILGVQYTYHEIMSANNLYVYINGPVQVNFCDWIVRPGLTNDIVIFTQKSFAEAFKESSSSNR